MLTPWSPWTGRWYATIQYPSSLLTKRVREIENDEIESRFGTLRDNIPFNIWHEIGTRRKWKLRKVRTDARNKSHSFCNAQIGLCKTESEPWWASGNGTNHVLCPELAVYLYSGKRVYNGSDSCGRFLWTWRGTMIFEKPTFRMWLLFVCFLIGEVALWGNAATREQRGSNTPTSPKHLGTRWVDARWWIDAPAATSLWC